ncbi:recombination-associated protein RdgC [Rosenbergiella collisarenosi]|uniref:recombination-associated protein RdgC n=1 Tax=Rosenbergiella collisarenosi TaxID=1544695 RepID=UPI001BDB0763|nr:recombination-associated protein RdgC [Rosenbergiella collisarenosi]MBT0722465.1 recombination-associated protein RdgC [Rosenbergiella collisarenosi]
MLTPFNVSNIVLYRLTNDIDLTNLEELAKKRVFTPCGPHDVSKTGWVPPMGDEFEAFTHHANGLVLLSYKTEKKNIPASTLKEYVDEKMHDQEQKLNRKLKKTEIATIKDNIKHELLPKTLPKATRTFIWLDVKAKLVMVNSSSPRAAENVTALLRGTIGSFPCVPVQLNTPVNVSLTNWVKTGDLPDALVTGFEPLIDSIDLPDVDDRHVAAAAVRSNAEIIVTLNLRDFPAPALNAFGIEALHPDDFVMDLFDLNRALVLSAATTQRSSLRKPPVSVDEYLEALLRQGMAQTVKELSKYRILI